jgi:tetratricopeptide (TPR) repeat protein
LAVDDLYGRVLERLESDGNGDNVRKVMTALWASRAGLTEPELLSITGLAPLQWSPINLALGDAFCRNGNRLVFDHDYLRIATEYRYLAKNREKLNAHRKMANLWNRRFAGSNNRLYTETPWHLHRANEMGRLRKWLLKPWNIAHFASARGAGEACKYWRNAKQFSDKRLDTLLQKQVSLELRKFPAYDSVLFLADNIADILEEGKMHGPLLLELRQALLGLARFDGHDSFLLRLVQLAKEQLLLGLADKAVKTADSCLQIANSELHGNAHSSILFELGDLYQSAGNLSNALLLFKQTADIEVVTRGAGHPDALVTKERIAGIYFLLGNTEEGSKLYSEIIDEYRQVCGETHERTMETALYFAVLLIKNGFASLALPILEEHACWCRGREGEHGAIYLEASRLIAVSYRQMGLLDKAEALFLELVTDCNQVLEPGNFKVGSALAGLAKTLEAAGKLEEALIYAQQALDYSLVYEGQDSWSTNSDRLDLARVLHKLGRDIEAINYLDELQQRLGNIAVLDDQDRQLLAEVIELRTALGV